MTIQPLPRNSQGPQCSNLQPGHAPLPQTQVPPDEVVAGAVLQTKIGLDGREEIYQGILSATESAVCEGSPLAAMADRPLTDLTDQELRSLFGDQADRMKDLGQSQPELTGNQVLPFLKHPNVLDRVSDLLENRPDLLWEDLVHAGPDGKVRLDPALQSETSRELLKSRSDIHPAELARMSARFQDELGDEKQAKAAQNRALNHLQEHSDARPEQLSAQAFAPTRINPRDLPDFADKPISEMTEAELTRLFGNQSAKIKEIGQLRPGVTGTQIFPLHQDVKDLESIKELFEKRPDLEWGDLVKVGSDGKTRVDPSATDATSRELLLVRQDVKPIELTQMAAIFVDELRDPALAETARRKALALLKERTDVKPQELAVLMQTLVRGQDGNAGMSAAAAVDMFDSSARLLTTRRDLKVEDATKVAHSVLGMAGKKDSQSGLRSATAMSEAVDTLIVRQDLGAESIAQLTHTMGRSFPGQDEGSSADRHLAFSKGLGLLRQIPGMDPGTIGVMMQKAAEGPPPRKGIRLLQAFDTFSQGVVSGRANMEWMRDPLARPDPTGQKKRDGEIVLDKYGNEKGDTEDRPKLAAHQAASGSQTEPERRPGERESEASGQEGLKPAEPGGAGPEAAGPTEELDPQARRQPNQEPGGN